MAGVSDLPFRRLCQQNGADYSTAEMISAKPELLHTAYSAARLQFDLDPRYPKIVQLVGGDAALLAEAALLMQAKGADIIDLNMGCPAKTVAKQQAGSALLADLRQVEKILTAVVRAVNIPVTLKTRLGYHDGQPVIAEVARIAEACGIAALAVHGRSRAQRYQGEADYATIAAAKAKTRLPVIANGDIKSAEQAKTLLDRYGFDGIMIGRAALGDPWLFARCQTLINGCTSTTAHRQPPSRANTCTPTCVRTPTTPRYARPSTTPRIWTPNSPSFPAKTRKTMPPLTIRAAIEHSIAEYYALHENHDERITGLYDLIISEAEHAIISHIMQRCRDNQSHAARILGITRNTLKKKLTQHRIPYQSPQR